VLILGVLAALAIVVPTAAGGAEVTRGRFHAFAVGAGMDISGHAVMVRTADGRTFVSVHVEGLAPNTTYASHVHAKACGDAEANGHYQHEGTAVNDENEIWPGFTTNSDGIGNGKARNGWTAGPSAVSVVVHRPGATPNKIACADLE
jgi:Cu-Zn family superoxide dismutase